MAAQPVAYRFTVEQYHRMAGRVLAPGTRVELLEGQVVDMSPIGSGHAGCVKRLNQVFTTALIGRAVVGVQDPVELSDLSEPQPDVVLLKPSDDFYSHHHPLPADVLLAVEVADTSWDHDRNRKTPLYLAFGIPEVWVVDLANRAIEVVTAAGSRRLGPGDAVSPTAFPDLVVEVADILG